MFVIFSAAIHREMDSVNRHEFRRRARTDRTGHTMRRADPLDIYPHTLQFTIHKCLRSREILTKDEMKAISDEFSSYVDDGGLEPMYIGMRRAEDSSWNGKFVFKRF